MHKPVEALQLQPNSLGTLALNFALPVRRVHVCITILSINMRYLFLAILKESQQLKRLLLPHLGLAHFVKVLAD